MAGDDLLERVLEAARERIDQSVAGHIDGEQVAVDVGLQVDDPRLYHAFREIERSGALQLEGWRGGMGLPSFVSRPGGEPPAVSPPRRSGLLHALAAPLRWFGREGNSNVDRIVVGVLIVVVAAVVTGLVKSSGGSNPSGPPTSGASQSGAARTQAAKPEPSDGRDPKRSHCSPPAEDVNGTETVLSGHGLRFGTLVLRHSLRCDTSWGTVRGLGPEEKLRLVVLATRPADHATTSYARFGAFNPEGVFGNQLRRGPGCIIAIAVIEHNGRTLARARTPCR